MIKWLDANRSKGKDVSINFQPNVNEKLINDFFKFEILVGKSNNGLVPFLKSSD